MFKSCGEIILCKFCVSRGWPCHSSVYRAETWGVRCLNPVVKSYSVSFVYPGGGPAIVLCIELQPGGSGV